MEDTNNEDTNKAEAISSLTDEELTEALASLPSLRDFITVPDGGLVFRTTTDRPLLHLLPTEDGTRLDIYSAAGNADVQILVYDGGSMIHFAQQGRSLASVGANTVGGVISVSQASGTPAASMSAGTGGGFVLVKNAEGENVAGLEGTPQELDGDAQVEANTSEADDPFMALLMQPRPGEIMH